MATTMEGLQRQIEESNNNPTTLDDVEAQLNYLLNKTVRGNASYSLSLNFERISKPARNKTLIETGDSIAQAAMSLETLTEKTKKLHDKIRNENKHWWTFADVVPTWEEKIQAVFRGEITGCDNEDLGAVLLNEGGRCIMGESWGGHGWGDCSDCGWLGNQGLKLFCGHHASEINPNGSAGFAEYKMRYEYHWNKHHYDVGNKESKVPNI